MSHSVLPNGMETLADLLRSFPQRGDAPALVYRTGVRRLTWGYAELHLNALRTAALLQGMGLQRGERVLLWGPNSPAWVAAFFGVVAAGGVAVPVDFMSGRERALSIAGMSRCRVLFQSSYKADRIDDGTPSILLEELEGRLAGLAPAEPVQASPDDAAQLVYTSGTTGSPKGVVLTHRNLMANLRQINLHLPVVDGAFRFLSVLPLSHMFEQTGGLLTPLCNGASIVYLRTMKPSAMMEALAEENISVLILVPRLLQMLKGSIEQELSASRAGRFLRSLGSSSVPAGVRRLAMWPVRRKFGAAFRFFVSGGAALDPELFRFWESLGMKVIEGYGLTECSPVITAGTLERSVAGSAGKALPGVELRTLNGEIQVRGGNVFPGYFENPEATAAVFTPDGWFRTGDMGELDPEGWLRIRGRSKEMIVTGAGVNVYPDEIEPILNRTPGVREACVIGLDKGGGETVHAVIIPDGSGRGIGEIMAEVNSRLDSLAQLTGCSVWEGEFPKTTTMKIRKFQVKERLERGGGEGAPPTASDPLVEVVARVTGHRTPEVKEESFLVSDLGLTSIGRLELVTFLEQTYRLDLEESLIGPQTRVSDLRGMVSRREKVTSRSRIRPWTNSAPIRIFRRLADLVLHYPLFRLFVRLRVRGRENLRDVAQPVFFISNHLSYLDQPALMAALPPSWRYNTATAAWEEFFFARFGSLAGRIWKRLCFDYATVAFNIFPLPQSAGFRRSMAFMGSLADRGVNVLLFPEGERSATGHLLPFRPGLGMMVKELGIPVVPLAISGLEDVFPRGALFPKRGTVAVAVGKPLYFTTERPEEIVERCRVEVEELRLSVKSEK